MFLREDYEGKIIQEIKFSGLQRTKESFIQSKVSRFIGKKYTEETPDEIIQALMLENLFEKVAVISDVISEESVCVNVYVTEKITFVPLPFAGFSSGKFFGGLTVLDTNAFGVKDLFLLGGFYSSSARTGFAAYSRSPKDNHVPGFGVSFSAASNKKEILSTDNETYALKYNSQNFSAGLSVSEKINDMLSLKTGLSFVSVNAEDVSGYEGAADSVKMLDLSQTIGLGFSKWNGWFVSSCNTSLTANILFSNKEKYRTGKSVDLTVSLQKSFDCAPRLLFASNSAFVYSCDTHVSQWHGRSAVFSTILPDSFVTQEICGTSDGIEFALAKSSFATYSIFANYEAVRAKNFDGSYEICHGPSFGGRIYMSKIAFPALAVVYSYNVTKDYWQYSASLGIGR